MFYYDDPIEAAPKKSARSKFLGLVAATLLLSFGTTLAANINIGTGGNLEFGQGIQVQTACDQNIAVATSTKFNNATNANNNSFSLESVTVSDVAAACVGKSFKVNFYDSATAASLNGSPVIVSYSATPVNGQTFNGSTWSSGSTDIKVLGATLTRATIDTTGTGADSRVGKTSFTLTSIKSAANASVVSTVVARVSMESAEYQAIYAIGDTGPGGGTIFLTPLSLGNATGNYFEFAPVDVETSTNPATGSYSGIIDKNNTSGREIGAGLRNTNDITAKSTTGGAWAAKNYSNNGYSDWFLPSNKELQAICMYARGLLATRNPATDSCNTGTLTGTWAAEYISSSTRGYDTYTWRGYFSSIGEGFNWQAGAVRPIRMFAAE